VKRVPRASGGRVRRATRPPRFVFLGASHPTTAISRAPASQAARSGISQPSQVIPVAPLPAPDSTLEAAAQSPRRRPARRAPSRRRRTRPRRARDVARPGAAGAGLVSTFHKGCHSFRNERQRVWKIVLVEFCPPEETPRRRAIQEADGRRHAAWSRVDVPGGMVDRSGVLAASTGQFERESVSTEVCREPIPLPTGWHVRRPISHSRTLPCPGLGFSFRSIWGIPT